MSNLQTMSTEELFALPKNEFINRCKEWCNEFNDGQPMKTNEDNSCPVHAWVALNGKKCAHETVANIAQCPICDQPMCPDCMNHNVHQLSRVTGYISNVSGWNAAKRQELKDRVRSDVK
ncbi:MAG: oxidoreductase [Methanococcoides sp.]|nr:oxidoreductase [Methanococcoides sp.]